MKKSLNKSPQWWSLVVNSFLTGTLLGVASYTILQFTQTSGATSSVMGLPQFVHQGGPIELAEKLSRSTTIRGGETHFLDASNRHVIRCAQVLPKSLKDTTWEELYSVLASTNKSPNNGLIDPVRDQSILESLGVCSASLPVPVTQDGNLDRVAYYEMLEENTPKAYAESSIFTTTAIISFLTLLIVSLLLEIIFSDDTLVVTNKIFPLLKPFFEKKLDEEFSQRIEDGIKNPGNGSIIKFVCSVVGFALVLNLMTSAVSPIPFEKANKLGLANYTTCIDENNFPKGKDMGGISPTGRDENGELIPYIKPLTKRECDPNGKYYPAGQVIRFINDLMVKRSPAWKNAITFPPDGILRILASPLKAQWVGTWWVYEGLLQTIKYWLIMALVGILMNVKSWLTKEFIVKNNLYNPTQISPTTIPVTHLPTLPESPNSPLPQPIDVNLLNHRFNNTRN